MKVDVICCYGQRSIVGLSSKSCYMNSLKSEDDLQTNDLILNKDFTD